MNDIPNDLKYTKTHEWLKTGDEEMVLGITAHAQELLGDMVYVELPAVGQIVNSGDEIGVVESVKAASDFYSPISGTVIEINQKVSDDPAIVNKDPYGAGWLVKIKASNPSETQNLLNAEQYRNEIVEEL